MSWIDEQIRTRIKRDDEAFEDACDEITAAVLNQNRVNIGDEKARMKSAIDEILHYYRLKSHSIPNEIKNLEDRLEYLCRPNGIMYRRVKLEKGWYHNSTGAMLGKLKDGNVVALLPSKTGGYVYYDILQNKKIKLNKKTETLFEEEAICFYRPFPLRKMTMLDLGNYIRQCNTPLTVIKGAVLLLIATLMGMITPRITQVLFSDVLNSGSIRVLVSIAVLSISVSISIMFVGSARALIMRQVNTNIEVSVQAATMARILSLPTDFFKEYSSGEITSRSQYIGTICSSIASVFLSSSLTSIFSLVYISQVFIYAPQLVLPSVCITLATAVVSQISTFINIGITRDIMKYETKKNGMTYSMISGVQKLKLSGSEKRAFARWLNIYSKETALSYGPLPFLINSSVIPAAISFVGTIIMYYFAIKSQVSIADYYAFTAAYGSISGAFMALSGVVAQAASIRPTLEMAKPILEAVPEVSEGKHVITKLSGGIELSNVSFRYAENMPLILDNLSLKIRAGQYVAVVGKTGCGKSTLVRLLLGFETPQKGAVYFDGKDISTVDLKSLRKNIGVVMQNGKLVQADIFSNIVIAAPWLTMKDAWEAAEIAGIADDIRKMPMGMHTLITEGSGGISGGQKQRLLIARAIAAKPKILIFDEATSALDNITQTKISKALDAIKCTRIVIAHRLSTIRQCDRIILLDGGKIAEDGKYDELIEANKSFAELVKRQRIEV